MIFSKRWYGIKGETIEPGSKYEMFVVRVQTSKDGAWQALTEKELEQLVQEHNKIVHNELVSESITTKEIHDAIDKPIARGKYKKKKFAIEAGGRPRFNIKEQVKVLGPDSLLPKKRSRLQQRRKAKRNEVI